MVRRYLGYPIFELFFLVLVLLAVGLSLLMFAVQGCRERARKETGQTLGEVGRRAWVTSPTPTSSWVNQMVSEHADHTPIRRMPILFDCQ